MRKRKRRIVIAATKLISEGGVEACTMRELAKKASLDVTTLYNYYGSKEEILNALRRSTVRRIQRRVDEPNEVDAPTRLRSIVEIWLGTTEAPPEVARPVYQAPTFSIPGTGPVEGYIKQLLVQELERATEQGVLLDVDHELLALAIIHLSRVWLGLWARGDVRAAEVAAQMAYAVDLILLSAATDAGRQELSNAFTGSQKLLRVFLDSKDPSTSEGDQY